MDRQTIAKGFFLYGKRQTPFDCQWIGGRLFDDELQCEAFVKVACIQLWHYPPPPNREPSLIDHFEKPLFIWTLKSKWRFLLHCPKCTQELTKNFMITWERYLLPHTMTWLANVMNAGVELIGVLLTSAIIRNWEMSYPFTFCQLPNIMTWKSAFDGSVFLCWGRVL